MTHFIGWFSGYICIRIRMIRLTSRDKRRWILLNIHGCYRLLLYWWSCVESMHCSKSLKDLYKERRTSENIFHHFLIIGKEIRLLDGWRWIRLHWHMIIDRLNIVILVKNLRTNGKEISNKLMNTRSISYNWMIVSIHWWWWWWRIDF